MEIEPRMRRVYRRALRAAESAGGALPPTPFDREGDRDFIAWLGSPVDGGPLTLYGLTAWMDEPSVRERFPELPGPDAARLAQWLVAGGAESLGMAPGLCRAGTAVPVG
jgi:hypothetical protein